MTTFLLDANTLIALTVIEHEHHDAAATWLAGTERFAICPVVEGALVRFLLRLGETGDTAAAVLRNVRAHPSARFWPDRLSYVKAPTDLTRDRQRLTEVLAAEGTYAALLATLRPSQTYLIAT